MVLIFCDTWTARSKYIFDWIFGQWGIKYTITHDSAAFEADQSPKIWYSQRQPPGQVFTIGSAGLLSENSVRRFVPPISGTGGSAKLFPAEGTLAFDVFSAAFFMISRYEEYLPSPRDQHGRFKSASGIAARNEFLTYPIVDIWLKEMRGELSRWFPQLRFEKKEFEAMLTYDIDVAFKFRGRSAIPHLAGAFKDILTLRLANFADRIGAVYGGRNDPWDVFGFIENELTRTRLPAIFFFPAGSRTRYDRNPPVRNPEVRALIKRLSECGAVGLHPSYYSSEQPGKLQTELNVLRKVLEDKVTASRQHFLRFSLPDTFLQLERAGISDEYSIAFADAPGFRAGTCTPFPFYDLSNERITGIDLYPACWMDATFVNYKADSIAGALKVARLMIQRVKEVGGVFIPIFHNEHLASDEMQQLHIDITNAVIMENHE